MARIRNIAVPFLLVTIIASFFTGVYSCARGCRCVGSNKFRAVCSMSYRFSHDPPVFVERTITSLETHRLMFEDLEPYFHALGDRLKEVIIFPGSYHYWEDKIRERLFHGLNRVEKLFIRGTRDQRTPVGLEAALKVDLPALKSIELRGNTLLCDCTLPDILAERRIFVTEKSGIYPIKNCDEDYYSRRTFSFENFQKECARKGGYTLPDFSNTEFKNYKEKVKWGTHIKTPEEHGYNRRKIPKSYWEDRKKKEEEIRRRLATVPAKISREQRQKEFKQRHTHHMWKHLRKRRSVGADTPEELGVDEQPVNSERNGPIAEQGSTTDIEGMVQPPVDPQSNTVLEVIDAQDAPDEIQDLDLPESFLGGDNVQNLDHDLVPTDNGPENSRPHGEHHSSNREHTKGAGYGAAQLAFLQLPMNDLTIRLNPYDPFEVDLFFKYVLHKNYPV